MSSSKVHDESLDHDHSQTVDLAMLHQKPSCNRLLSVLKDLELPQKSWNGDAKNNSANDAKAVSQYLLSIISSDLGWLDKYDEGSDIVATKKDEIWELASKRLAERCGRSAMPEIIRTWTVPRSSTKPELKFEIREPPLTGDNLGLKTWGTAFAIVKKLDSFGRHQFVHLLNSICPDPGTYIQTPQSPHVKILELGSGTGLVGIAAAVMWGVDTLLTDLPEIQENLLFNIKRNTDEFDKIRGGVLDWKNPDSLKAYKCKEFEIILATDPLYDDEHPQLVADNIKRYLKPCPDSRTLVAIPLRDSHTEAMAVDFKKLMKAHGLELIDSGKENCHDDWAEDDIEAVKCWWGIWKPEVLENDHFQRKDWGYRLEKIENSCHIDERCSVDGLQDVDRES